MLDLTYETPKPKVIAGAKHDWELVIGMEVHAQVASKAKLFSGASTQFGAEPNSNVSFVDAAMPGMLPVINEYCIEQAVRTGLGLKAQINLVSAFDRKNYFYPDLPQGYQISQLYHPLVGEGQLLIEADEKTGIPEDKVIGIERIHVEQDAGKLMHDQHPTMSYVDLNRSGVALMEIVSKPDMRSPAEAGAYVRKLRSILRYVGSCDGNMEEGSMRADVNVSVRKVGAEFGTRCEIKNVNSIRFMGQAIEYEARRQIEILEDGGEIEQETRLFDPTKGETRSMRSKEEAHDYRYFPDPDLLPLEFDDAYVEALAAGLPELPDDKKARLMADMGLSAYDASILVSEKAIADYFEDVARGRDGKTAANWVINDLLGALNKAGKSIVETPVTADQLALGNPREIVALRLACLLQPTMKARQEFLWIIAQQIGESVLGHAEKTLVVPQSVVRIEAYGGQFGQPSLLVAGSPSFLVAHRGYIDPSKNDWSNPEEFE